MNGSGDILQIRACVCPSAFSMLFGTSADSFAETCAAQNILNN